MTTCRVSRKRRRRNWGRAGIGATGSATNPSSPGTWRSLVRKTNWLARARGLAPEPFRQRRRLRPFVHADRRDQRLAAEPEEPARARQRRSGPQARRRARGREDRRHRTRSEGHRPIARQSGRYRHPGDRRRPVDRHAWHRNRSCLPVVPGGRHAARSAGRVGPRGRCRPRSRDDGRRPGFDRHARRDFDDHAAGGPRTTSRNACGATISSPAWKGTTNWRPTIAISVSSGVRSPSLGISTVCPTSPRFQRSSASTTSAK